MSGNHPKVIMLEPGGIASFEASYGEGQLRASRSAAACLVAPRHLPGPHRSQLVEYKLERCARPSLGFDVGRIEMTTAEEELR